MSNALEIKAEFSHPSKAEGSKSDWAAQEDFSLALQTSDHEEPSRFAVQFWRRGLIVLGIALFAGPLLGALALPVIEAMATLLKGSIPSFDTFLRNFQGAVGLSFKVGVPFALIAGLVMAWIVARRGTIGFGACALIAFLVPCIFSFPILGGLFVLSPAIGMAAALIAVAIRAVVGWVATRFAGMTIHPVP